MGIICENKDMKNARFIKSNKYEREHLYDIRSFFFKIGESGEIGYFIVSTKRIYLVTNNNIISQDKVDKKDIIFLTSEGGKKFEIKLDTEERFIKCFGSPIDLTFLEIKYSDQFEYFFRPLAIDTNFKEGYDKYKNKEIFILDPQKDEESQTIIKIENIKGDEFEYTYEDNSDFSSFPIILKENNRIIGIPKKNSKQNNNKKGGIFIGLLINQIERKTKFNSIKIKYKIKKNVTKLKIFDEIFVENNSDNCKLFINEEEYPLSSEIDITKFKIKNDSLEIKLQEINEITNMSHMFNNYNILSITDLEKWDTGNVIKMRGMFKSCELESLPDISNWNTGNVNDMSYMFSGCNFKTLPDISKWDISNVNYMSNMFSGLQYLTKLPDITFWNTKNVINMGELFAGCKSLKTLSEKPNISNWNTKKVIKMYQMFRDCQSLIYLGLGSWDTSKITDMSFMFYGCKSLVSLDRIGNWKTNNATTMANMFYGCESLRTIDYRIEKWDTSKVTDMSWMFYECKSLSTLPNISNWDVSNVISMNYMFSHCENLNRIPNLLKWKTRDDVQQMGIFFGCNSNFTIYLK